MLEKLSSVLKKVTDKVANAIFLDKNMVDSIVKDLQRALIEADVNVKLVVELTNKIKKAALDERVKGLEKKEHIIKLLHDELVKLLGESREIKLGKKYEEEIKDYDLVIVDSAGRDALSADLIKEIKDVSKMVKPTETFLVIAADIGQTAKKQAETFKEAVQISGVIITRMDSTAKAA